MNFHIQNIIDIYKTYAETDKLKRVITARAALGRKIPVQLIVGCSNLSELIDEYNKFNGTSIQLEDVEKLLVLL